MYKVLSDLPVEVQPFYSEVITTEDTGGTVAVSYNYEGLDGEQVTGIRDEPVMGEVITLVRKIRPPTKSTTDLERVISKGKPQHVIDKFSELVALGNSWNWFGSYCDYEHEWANVFEKNQNLVPDDETGEFPEPSPEPSPPIHANVSAQDIVAPHVSTILKSERIKTISKLKVTVDEMVFDADKESLSNISLKVMVLASATATTIWRLADNTEVSVRRNQLKKVLVQGVKELDKLYLRGTGV